MKPLTTTRTIRQMAATFEVAVLLGCSSDQVIAKFLELTRKCERYSGPQSDLNDIKNQAVTTLLSWISNRPKAPTQGV